MSEFISIAIIVLAAIVHASLQLGLGCLLLLYHESAGKHIQSKTRNLVGSFISGVGTIAFLLLATACFVISNTFDGALSIQILTAAIGILIALAIVMWFFYYRRGSSTELWLPQIVAKFINNRAKVTNSNTEAFSLGVTTGFAEMPFIIILLLVAGNSVLELDPMYQPLMVAFYTIIAIIPLVVFNIIIRTGHNVVEIQKWRVRNKLFLRIISGLGFLALGLFIFAFKILDLS
ncbi:hypothetical protein FWF89_02020 [Candidatus Saccharibacteria bacterium]|nr:hypothetical protein [Candidatus Saccharibacteria bacterium]